MALASVQTYIRWRHKVVVFKWCCLSGGVIKCCKSGVIILCYKVVSPGVAGF